MAGVAAFFDLDGTLIPRPSLERRFLAALRRRKAIAIGNYFAWLYEATRLLPRGINKVLYANKAYLRGIAVSELDSLMIPSFFPQAVERIAWHLQRGHAIVIVSGALEPPAKKAVAALKEELAKRGVFAPIEVFATRVEGDGEKWTGRIFGEAIFGEAKARAVRQFAAEKEIDLSQCFAYGDSTPDRWMLEAVGKPVAVNPSNDLARIAARNGYEIVHWREAETSIRSSESSSHPKPFPNPQLQISGLNRNEVRVAPEDRDETELVRAKSGYSA